MSRIKIKLKRVELTVVLMRNAPKSDLELAFAILYLEKEGKPLRFKSNLLAALFNI